MVFLNGLLQAQQKAHGVRMLDSQSVDFLVRLAVQASGRC